MGSTTNGALGKIWTREAIIFAIRKWANDYGEPPHSKLWKRSVDGYPSTWTVKNEFGSWNNAIRAAGFTPRSRGVTGHTDPEYTIERFVGAAIRRSQNA